MARRTAAANVLFVGGLLSLTAGVVVYLTAPSEKPNVTRVGALRVLPVVGPQAGGLVATGAF